MRLFLSVMLLAAGACNRGPEPKPFEAEAPAAAAAPTAAPSAPSLAPTAPAAPPQTPTTPSAGGLTWDAPPPFEAHTPSSSMRAAEYTLPAVNGDAPLLTVFFFGPGQGGSVDDNLKRWISQFSQPDGRDSNAIAKRATQQVNGMRVTTVDLTGTFAGMSSPMQAPGAPKTDQRLLGAIVEGPEGPVFFKLTGPIAALEPGKAAFDVLIQSLRPLR